MELVALLLLVMSLAQGNTASLEGTDDGRGIDPNG